MPKHPPILGTLSLPVIASPMFIVSTPELVVEQCKSGIIGTIPSLNGRSTEEFGRILTGIQQRLSDAREPAPYGVNLIAHRTNVRLEDDLAACIRHKVPLIITSLGVSSNLIKQVHDYGGVVFHDITN